jgi:hypothetical protein
MVGIYVSQLLIYRDQYFKQQINLKTLAFINDN